MASKTVKELIKTSEEEIIKYCDENEYRECRKLYILGRFFESTKNDFNKAEAYFKKASELDYSLASYHLGLCYLEDEHFNLNEAIKYQKLALKQGDTDASYELGYIYSTFEETKDVKTAVKYFKLNVENCDDEEEVKYSCNMIGYYYLFNEEIKDVVISLKYLLKGANMGNPSCYHNLGCLFSDEQEFRNMPLAIYCFEQAIKDDFTLSYYNLARIYHMYEGYIDIPKAIKYYKKAASKGIQLAYNNLGVIYRSVENYVDIKKCIYCYKRCKDSLADVNLAGIYSLEESKNMRLSFKYLVKAIERGNEQMLDYIDDIFNNLGKINSKDIKHLIASLESISTYLSYAAISYILIKIDENDENSIKSTEYALRSYELNPNSKRMQHFLGLSYFYGDGIEKDYYKARELLLKCSDIYDVKNELEVINETLLSSDSTITITEGDDPNTLINLIFKDIDVDEDIKTFVFSSLNNYFSSLEAMRSLKSEVDFSPCIAELYKTFENILRKYFVDGYRKYLKENVDPNDLKYNKYFVYLVDKNQGLYDYLDNTDSKYNRFTLGDLEKLTGIVYNKSSVFGLSLNLSGKKVNLIDKQFIDYLKTIFVKNENENNQEFEDRLNGYIIYLINFVRTNNQLNRNAAVHYEHMSNKEALKCLNSFLLQDKIIVNFYKYLKGGAEDGK